jgi:class 3 adenylate cyclase
VGAYLLERSQREVFAQGRLVGVLHDRVDMLLRTYLSPDVATTLIEDPDRASLGGVEVEVTVLFADLGGYTAFAERATPAEVVAMLNAAFSAAVPVVLAEGGAVVQFMGDAMMAIFNAPNPQPDHALRAARSALALQWTAGALPAAGERPRFRVGLNTGPAIVGNIGAAEIRNFPGHRRHHEPRGAPASVRAGGERRHRRKHVRPDPRPGGRPRARFARTEGEVAAG